MAGVKGRSGGARPNTGGARPGAGRKPKDKLPRDQPQAVKETEAAEFLRQVMQGTIIPTVPQLEAAKLLARLEVAGPKGKKEAARTAASTVAAGRFGAAKAPLKLVNGI